MESWKRLSGDSSGTKLLISMNSTNETSYELKVSDLNDVWQETLTAQETKARCKSLNPRLEAPLSNIVQHIKMSLESQETENVTVNYDSPNVLKIKIQNNFAGGIPFLWEFLCERSEERCHDIFLLPIGKLVMSLQVANDRLLEIIRKKDDEIKDYKEFSGATVSRPYLQTEEFDHEKFTENLRRSIEYQTAINKDIISVLTEQSVNDKLAELDNDISDPMPILSNDIKDRNAHAKIKGRVRNRRKIARAPARGVEIESDEDNVSEEAPRPKKPTPKPAVTGNVSKHPKKKNASKKKRLF